MKILIILTICLIAEIRSYSDQRRSPDGILDIYWYMNTTSEEVNDFDRILCEKNGNPQAYDDYVNKTRHFPICLTAVEDEIIEEFREGRLYDDLEVYYRKVCAKRPKYFNCLKNLTDSAKTCIEASKHETFDQLYNAIPSVFNFVCEDDAFRIRTYLSTNGDECLNSKSSELRLCGSNTFTNYVRETVSDGAEVGGIGLFNLLVPDATKCTVFNDFQSCIVNLLNDCPNQTGIADLATSIFGIVNNITNCDRLVRSTAAPTDIIEDVL